MFFESRGSLIVAAILVIAGCYQAVSSRKFAEAASREASTVGVITYISGGRSPSYEFKFVVNGGQRIAVSGSCRTLLNGCAVGKPVRVYYDPAQIVPTTLQEYGDRAREMLTVGMFLIVGSSRYVSPFLFQQKGERFRRSRRCGRTRREQFPR